MLEKRSCSLSQIRAETIKIRFLNPESSEFEALILFLSGIYKNQPIEQLRLNASMPKKEKIVLALDGFSVVGSCWLVDLRFGDFKVGGIGGVAVNEGYRGLGLAEDMVKFFTELDDGYDAYLAWTRVVGFFETLGFIDFSEGIERFDSDSTPMIKTSDEFLSRHFPIPKWERVKF